MQRLQQKWKVEKSEKAEERNKSVSNKPERKKETCLLWTQKTWKCVALQNMLPVGRENTGMKSRSKP